MSHVPLNKLPAADLQRAVATLTGQIRQVPPGVSAIKVGGRRAYRLARDGKPPDLPAREVTVSEFAVGAVRPAGDVLDVDVRVVCSSGTYIRALARDLGAALGVGGHLTALRRTRAGPYLVSHAVGVDELADRFELIPLAEAAAAAFSRRELTAEQARAVGHGARLPAAGTGSEPVAAFGPDGSLVALLTESDGVARPLAVFADQPRVDAPAGS